MKFIVMIDLNNGISKDGNQPVFIPKDLNLFKQLTENKIVLMGRKTFENLPNKKPLKHRINVILTKDKSYKIDNCIILNDNNKLIEFIKKYNNDIWVIGGAEIYDKLIDKCDEGYVTLIYKDLNCDLKINNLDKCWIKQGPPILKGYHNNIYFETFKYIKQF